MARRVSKEVKEEILSKVKAGERVVDLASQYGVSTKTIDGWLRQGTGEAVVSTLAYNQWKRVNEERKRLIGERSLNLPLQKKSQSSAVHGTKRSVLTQMYVQTIMRSKI
jgi:transposase-like protein